MDVLEVLLREYNCSFVRIRATCELRIPRVLHTSYTLKLSALGVQPHPTASAGRDSQVQKLMGLRSVVS